jgi:hypothetical protein
MNASEQPIPSCQEVFDRLPDWVEGRLGEQDLGPYQHHLELCPPCGHAARAYRALAGVARAALAVEMPEEARRRLRRLLLGRFRGSEPV